MEQKVVKSPVQRIIVDYLSGLKVSQRGFAKATGLSDSVWNKYSQMTSAMSVEVLDKILVAYPGVREALNTYLTGNKHPNITLRDKTSEKEENHMSPKETFYQDLIENNTEYSLLPKAILRDYKIVPDKLLDIITESKDQVNRELQKKQDLLIEVYEGKIDKLKQENENLRRQIPPKQ